MNRLMSIIFGLCLVAQLSSATIHAAAAPAPLTETQQKLQSVVDTIRARATGWAMPWNGIPASRPGLFNKLDYAGHFTSGRIAQEIDRWALAGKTEGTPVTCLSELETSAGALSSAITPTPGVISGLVANLPHLMTVAGKLDDPTRTVSETESAELLSYLARVRDADARFATCLNSVDQFKLYQQQGIALDQQLLLELQRKPILAALETKAAVQLQDAIRSVDMPKAGDMLRALHTERDILTGEIRDLRGAPLAETLTKQVACLDVRAEDIRATARALDLNKDRIAESSVAQDHFAHIAASRDSLNKCLASADQARFAPRIHSWVDAPALDYAASKGIIETQNQHNELQAKYSVGTARYYVRGLWNWATSLPQRGTTYVGSYMAPETKAALQDTWNRASLANLSQKYNAIKERCGNHPIKATLLAAAILGSGWAAEKLAKRQNYSRAKRAVSAVASAAAVAAATYYAYNQ